MESMCPRVEDGDSIPVPLAYRDHRMPLKAKIVAVLVVAYEVSSLDLIPDFIPVGGLPG